MWKHPRSVIGISSLGVLALLGLSHLGSSAQSQERTSEPTARAALAIPARSAPLYPSYRRTNPYVGLPDPDYEAPFCPGGLNTDCIYDTFTTYANCAASANAEAAAQWDQAQAQVQADFAAAYAAFLECEAAAIAAGTSVEPCYLALADAQAAAIEAFDASLATILRIWTSQRGECETTYTADAPECCE